MVKDKSIPSAVHIVIDYKNKFVNSILIYNVEIITFASLKSKVKKEEGNFIILLPNPKYQRK